MKPSPEELITQEKVTALFPEGKDNEFFDAFYGGAEDGAFDIRFFFEGYDHKKSELFFEFRLIERPGKCMRCNLTYGLPEVFERSPIINLKGIINGIGGMLNPYYEIVSFSLGRTTPKSPKINVIPLSIKITNGQG